MNNPQHDLGEVPFVIALQRAIEAQDRKDKQTDYSIALQRAIEAHCRGERIPPDVAAKCPHHAEKLDTHLEAGLFT